MHRRLGPSRAGSHHPALRAAAAVFVTPVEASSADLGSIGEAFGLTPAETRLLLHVAQGESVGEAAQSLGIGRNTSG